MNRHLQGTWAPGTQLKEQMVPQDRQQAVWGRLSRAASFSVLSTEYAFYTPALIYRHVRLGKRDPVLAFQEEYGREVQPLAFRFQQPLFAGLEMAQDPSWNHVLYALEHETWSCFRSWLGTLSLVDRDLSQVWRVRWQDLVILDPLFSDRAAVLPARPPQLQLTVFCLDGNRGSLYLVPPRHSWMGVPRLFFNPRVHADTRAFARAALADENPVAAADAVRPIIPVSPPAGGLREIVFRIR